MVMSFFMTFRMLWSSCKTVCVSKTFHGLWASCVGVMQETTRWDCSCSRTVSESRCRLLWSKDPKFSFLSRFCKKCSRTFLPFITGAGPPRLFRLTITSDCSRSQWWNKGGLCAGMNEIVVKNEERAVSVYVWRLWRGILCTVGLSVLWRGVGL